jgi:DNA adenine methylase
MCQKDLDKVVFQILEWRSQFSIGKDLHNYLTKEYLKFNDIQKASAFFILNRITFSGTSDSGGYSEQAFKKRFTISSIERLKQLKTILGEVKITNYDYEEVVKAEGDNVFIFLDPPYYSTAKSGLYGKNGHLHKSFDHYRFAEIMRKCKHKWLITYDDSKFIRDIFSFANIVSWDLTYGMRNVTPKSNQIGKELFIANYSFDFSKDYSLSFLENVEFNLK